MIELREKDEIRAGRTEVRPRGPFEPAKVIGSELNALEPPSLRMAFMRHPPAGFRAFGLPVGDGSASAFLAKFDILTTLDDRQVWIRDLLAKLKMGWLTRMLTVFSGTTVGEYTTYPRAENFNSLLYGLVGAAETVGAQLAILKDLPVRSPLLSDEENEAADSLRELLEKDGRFLSVAGQALAYVPMNFASIDEYLSRVSKTRRKDLRKKLRTRDNLVVEELRTGSAFRDVSFLEELYAQYLSVFEQSKYHFDKLSFAFFQSVLTDDSNGGVVFLYRKDGELIGFNICFVHKGNLVDKYVGFRYPQAREANLYFVSWFYNLEFALRNRLRYYISGWTDPEVKAYLGASFTFTQHAVYVRNRFLRNVLVRFKHAFEPDQNWAEAAK